MRFATKTPISRIIDDPAPIISVYHEHAISLAVESASNSKKAWFFLRSLREVPNAKPWIALEEEDRVLVSIPSTTRDHTRQTINCPRIHRTVMTERATPR